MSSITKQASKFLIAGKVVAFPTDTVYALAASINSQTAIEKIYKLKHRNPLHPLAVLVANSNQAENYVIFNDIARKLAQQYWPGALTIILPAKSTCPNLQLINQQSNSLGVRMPDHPIALAILNQTGCPLVATSLNLSGKPPAASYLDIDEQIKPQLDLIIKEENANNNKLCMASTVIDLTNKQKKILRQGSVKLIPFLNEDTVF